MSSSSDVYLFFDRHPAFECILPLSPCSYLIRSGSTLYSCHHFVSFPSHANLSSLYLHFLNLSHSTDISLPPLSDILQLPDDTCLLITKFISGRRPFLFELPSLLPDMVSFVLSNTICSELSDHLVLATPNSFELLRTQMLASSYFRFFPDCLSQFLLLDPPRGSLSYCHGDFLPQNLVIDDHDNVFLIDWESTGLSSHQYDLGWLSAYCRLFTLSLQLPEVQYGANLDYFTRFGLVRFAYRILQQHLPQNVQCDRISNIVSLFDSTFH